MPASEREFEVAAPSRARAAAAPRSARRRSTTRVRAARVRAPGRRCHLYISASFAPIALDTYSPVKPPMWKNGNVCSDTGCGGGFGGGFAVDAREARRDHAAEKRIRQIGDVIAMRRERAFRPPGRARRVHDRRVVVGRDADVGQTRRDRGTAASASSSDSAYGEPTASRTPSTTSSGSFDRYGAMRSHALAVEYRGARAGILERVVQFVAGPPRIQRDRDRADRLTRPERQHPFRIVAHADRHAIALAGCRARATDARAHARADAARAYVQRSSS